MSTFNPTPGESALTARVFTIADPQNLGIVTGDTAVKILSGANLSHAVLGEVWSIADKDNNGFLTKKGVAVALRLIGHAQKGEPITETLLDKPGPLAHIDGVSRPVAARSPPPSSPASQSFTSVPSSTLPPLTQQDKTKFLKLFIGCGPVNGLLSGEKSRDVFVKSKLPYEKLSHIWTLSDTKTRGALDSTDFTVGMYLIQAAMSSPSLALPSSLPSWVYDQAAQSLDANSSVVSHATGGSASALSSPHHSAFQIPRQYTGSATPALGSNTVKPQPTGQQLPQTPKRQPPTYGFARPSVSPPLTASVQNTKPSSEAWSVSPDEKASSDKFFDGLDPQGRGYIEGEVAVPFMLESKLAETELAQIWDLADLSNDGRLTREGFAVAMHIINSRLAGNEIPLTLPPSLVPPSMRTSHPSTRPAMNEAQFDLLLDDTLSGSALQPEQTSGSTRIQLQPSAFGHNAGMGAPSLSYQDVVPPLSQSHELLTSRPAANKDLLGDDDDEASRPESLPDNSAEIGNLRNQISSTTRSLETTRVEKLSVEQTVTQQAAELSQLQTQLTSAKAAYETESQHLANLRERLASQRVDIQKGREELISAESELSATKVEKAEVEGSVLGDKEEIRELQRKMKEVGAETDVLKAGIEKSKKDVRQQKGLLAIAKKQLATAEAEKLRSTKELEVVQKELEVAQQEKRTVDEHLSEIETAPSATPDDFIHVDSVTSPAPSTSADAIPLPDTPHSTTPRPQARQSTNPFERLVMASVGADDTIPLPVSSPLNDDAIPVERSEIFILPSLPTTTETPPSQTSMTVPDIAIQSEPTAGIAAAAGVGSVPSVSTISPAENDAPIVTPPHGTQGMGKELSETQPSLPGAYPFSIDGDGALGPLHEIENNESDTSDSDDEPLGTKYPSKSDEQLRSERAPPGLEQLTSNKPAFDDTFAAVGHSVNPPATGKASPATSGTSSPTRSRSPGRALSTRTLSSHSVAGAMDPFNASNFSHTPLEPPGGPAAPPPTIETVLEPSASAATHKPSSLTDFDEALGKLPSSTKDPSPGFNFDSAFDDNFDFASAMNGTTGEHISSPAVSTSPGTKVESTVSFFPPVSAPLVPSIAVEARSATSSIPGRETADTPTSFLPALSPTNGTASVSFDDAFGLSSPIISNSNGQQSTANGNGQPFDVFGSMSPETPSLISGNPFPTGQPSKLADTLLSSPARSASPPIRPASPYQSRVTSISSSKTTSSPPLPPRASSPRLRAASGSKALSPENKAETTTKHKLSIRFPFGRKDKSKDKEDKRVHSQLHQQLPDPQQYLSPVSEPPLPGAVTPAVEDDAEPVKQLAAMGFSRTQSIAALETHGYDMQKALNSLLGAA